MSITIIIILSLVLLCVSGTVVYYSTKNNNNNDDETTISNSETPSSGVSLKSQTKNQKTNGGVCDVECIGEHTILNDETCECECEGNWIQKSTDSFMRRGDNFTCSVCSCDNNTRLCDETNKC